MPDESVSIWISNLKAGDVGAARPICDRYFERLVRLARGQLSARIRRVADEEDVALSAFHSFCRAAEAGRFPKLEDRDDLWAILVTLTERKAYAQVDRHKAAKRGSGQVRGDSILQEREDGSGGVVQLPSPEPTPAFAAEIAEECERLLKQLSSREPLLRDIAVWKLEGCTNEEIASRGGKSLATIERKLALIRTLWNPGVAT